MCPTSLFPICPSGSPTLCPKVVSSADGYLEYKESTYGVFALSMAETLGFFEIPHPSRIIKITFFEIFKFLI